MELLGVKQFAAYYKKFNIRVNAICPGGIINNNLKKKIKFIIITQNLSDGTFSNA